METKFDSRLFRDAFAKSFLHEVRERISSAEYTMSLTIIDELLRGFFFLTDSRVATSQAVSYAICIEDIRFTWSFLGVEVATQFAKFTV